MNEDLTTNGHESHRCPVDPEKMIEARKAGASVEEIHQRAYAGEWPAEFDPRVPL